MVAAAGTAGGPRPAHALLWGTRGAPPAPAPRRALSQDSRNSGRLLSDSELNVLWKWLPDHQAGGAFRTGPTLNIKSPSLLVRTGRREAGGGKGLCS